MNRCFSDRDRARAAKIFNLSAILNVPVVSEKSLEMSKSGKYVFRVARTANKHDIKRACETLYSVSVVSVNTISVIGKRKVFKGKPGKRSSWKKAIISLAPGSTIDIGVDA